MDDARLWGSETGLWTADPDHYREIIADDALMILPGHASVLVGADAIPAVSATPRWSTVTFSDQQVSRPHDGLIVIAYAVEARLDHEVYRARCSTTYLRHAHDDWHVIQHQQSAETPAS